MHDCSEKNNTNACHPGLSLRGASLSLPGRPVLSDLSWVGNQQTVNVNPNCMAMTTQTGMYATAQIYHEAHFHIVNVIIA